MNKQVSETIPASRVFRWQILAALAIKVVLLTGLWWLIFRWQDRPISKPDIAAHFALPAVQQDSAISLQTTTEDRHVR